VCSLRRRVLRTGGSIGMNTAIEGGSDAGILEVVVECVHLSRLCFFAIASDWL